MALIRELLNHRDLLRSLIVRNLKIRYKGSYLGFFWSLMDPLFMVLVYFMFAKLTRFQVDLPYLVTGVLTWQFLSLCMGDSFHTILGNPSLIKKVFFPRIILPLTMVLANLINFFLSLFILIGFLFFLGVDVSLNLFYLPIFIFFEFLLALGFSLLFSSLMVYFQDTQHLVSVGLMSWFFLSPVIYPLKLVPERLLKFYLLNPMAGILMGFRHCFLEGPFFWGGSTASSFILCGVVFALGLYVFMKLEPYFADEL
ncbi:MAG: ABC transporter permease [Chlamydiae bacterium]|nr:ABC transporter permease [Chlamydiota bacterium]MBI3266530.1 ABC transporter permease [Chlamydiota bacterium]